MELAKPGDTLHISEKTILQDPLAKLSWYHHIALLDKVKDGNERLFYVHQAVQNGWSRDVMVHQIDSDLYKRQGQINNKFKHTVGANQSELIRQLFKDPYKFDFIYLGQEAREREIEDALTNQLTKFLIFQIPNSTFSQPMFSLLGDRTIF